MVFLLIFLSISLSHSVPLDSYYISPFSETIETYSYQSKNKIDANSFELTTKQVNILKDFDNRINTTFHIQDYFYDSVSFWYRVYTAYSSKTAIIHDRRDLSVIIKIINFDNLFNSNIHFYSKLAIKRTLIDEELKNIKADIVNYLSDNKINDTIIRIKQLKGTLDKNYLKSLIKNLRYQTGQNNKIRSGIVNYLELESFFTKISETFKLPVELFAIPFLETSFNPKAISKSGAAGIWQFMPLTGSLLMPKRSKVYDARLNTYISTVAAMHLLKENKLVTGSWDLAITAYNSGTRNITKAKKQFKKKVDLKFLINNYRSSSFGFASANFYSEFLALVHVLAYKSSIFNIQGVSSSKKDIYFYLSKCRIKPDILYANYPSLKLLNNHLLNSKHIYPKSTIIVSNQELPKSYYHLLTDRELKLKVPKKWRTYLKKKCGAL